MASLKSRLEQASRKTNFSDSERESLVQERDRAHKKLQEGCASIAKLTRKLSTREQELQEARAQLESSTHHRQNDDDARREIITLSHHRDELEIENANLQDENVVLREKVKELQDEMASVRTENSNMGQRIQSLLSENRSMRSTHQIISDDVNELQENLDEVLHELDAAREEIETLRSQARQGVAPKHQHQQTQQSVQRQTHKVTIEATSSAERAAHDLHENTLRLKERTKTLKKQMAQTRAPVEDEVAAPVAEYTEKNMTSAYILPDITIHSDENGNTETEDMPEPPELTEPELMLGPYKVIDPRTASREEVEEKSHKRSRSASRMRPQSALKSQNALTTVTEMSFDEDVAPVRQALPKSKSTSNVVDRHARRNKTEKSYSTLSEHVYEDSALSEDESVISEPTSVAKQLNVDTTHPSEVAQERTNHSQLSHHSRSQSQARKTVRVNHVEFTDLAINSCPTLSRDARQVLSELCEHDCKNCIVCTRIASHQGVVSSAEAASGKKRVTVSRPVPVTDRALPEDATMRPSQSPGHALALVIKGLEDEARHLKHALAKLNAKYTSADKAFGRSKRLAMAEAIHTLLRQLEVKNDQIYSLYDVLEGQKAAGQAMTEEDVEMTVLNITGMTVGDVTSHSQQFTWEGFADC